MRVTLAVLFALLIVSYSRAQPGTGSPEDLRERLQTIDGRTNQLLADQDRLAGLAQTDGRLDRHLVEKQRKGWRESITLYESLGSRFRTAGLTEEAEHCVRRTALCREQLRILEEARAQGDATATRWGQAEWQRWRELFGIVAVVVIFGLAELLRRALVTLMREEKKKK